MPRRGICLDFSHAVVVFAPQTILVVFKKYYWYETVQSVVRKLGTAADGVGSPAASVLAERLS